MKKLTMVLLALSMLLSVICCGCDKPNSRVQSEEDTAKLLEDLAAWPLGFEEYVEISALDIVKRNVEDKKDEVYVKAIGSTESVKCEMYYKLTYNLYTVGGWILDEVEITDKEKWAVTPEKGIDAKELDSVKEILKTRAAADYGIDITDATVSILSETLSQDKTEQTVKAKLTSTTAKRDFAMETTRVYEFSYSLTDNTVGWEWTCTDSEYNVLKNIAYETKSQPVVVYEPVEQETVSSGTLYRVRKSASNAESQIGAFKNYESAKKLAEQRKADGYEVYDTDGNLVYNPNAAISDGTVRYRVRKSANDAKSQIGAYSIFENARNEVDRRKGEGYEVYDMDGNMVYAP